MDELDSSDEESNTRKRGSRRNSIRRKSNCGDEDGPSGMSLLNHRSKSAAVDSKRGMLA